MAVVKVDSVISRGNLRSGKITSDHSVGNFILDLISVLPVFIISTSNAMISYLDDLAICYRCGHHLHEHDEEEESEELPCAICSCDGFVPC